MNRLLWDQSLNRIYILIFAHGIAIECIRAYHSTIFKLIPICRLIEFIYVRRALSNFSMQTSTYYMLQQDNNGRNANKYFSIMKSIEKRRNSALNVWLSFFQILCWSFYNNNFVSIFRMNRLYACVCSFVNWWITDWEDLEQQIRHL